MIDVIEDFAEAIFDYIPNSVISGIKNSGNALAKACVTIPESIVSCEITGTPDPTVVVTKTQTRRKKGKGCGCGCNNCGGKKKKAAVQSASKSTLVAEEVEEIAIETCCQFGNASSYIEGLDEISIRSTFNITVPEGEFLGITIPEVTIGTVSIELDADVTAGVDNLQIDRRCPAPDCENDMAKFRIKIGLNGTFKAKVTILGATPLNVTTPVNKEYKSGTRRLTCTGPLG
jgi:hypothetical protein